MRLQTLGVETRTESLFPNGPKSALSDGRHRLAMAATILAAAGIWLLAHPFTFRENDGQLYAFMALASRAPRIFANDLFIRYGSQDAFSSFSPIYGFLVARIGLAWATMLLMLLGASLWLFGCWRLLNTILDRSRAQIALVLMAALHITYGGFSVLFLDEGFVTSRIFAEAISLLALGEFAQKRWARGSISLAVGASLHPLMGLAGVTVAVMSEALKRPWILALGGVGAMIAIGAGLTGIAPFDRLFTTMQGPWLASIQYRIGFLFVTNWTLNDWAVLASQACAVVAATIRARGWPRRFFLATLGAAASGILASWVGGDIFRNTLIIQLQLWRWVWPLAWASVAALFFIVPRSRDAPQWVVPSLFVAALLPGQGWTAVSFAMLALAGSVLRRPLTDRVAKVLLAASAFWIAAYLFIFMKFFVYSWTQLQPIGLSDLAFVNSRYWLAWIIAPILSLLIFRTRFGGISAAVILAALSLAMWDMREPWQRYVMNGPAPVNLVAPVLWETDSLASWMLLRSPAYVSVQQRSGTFFSPDTAAVFARRLRATGGIMPDSTWGPNEHMQTCDLADPILSSAALTMMCSTPDAPGSVVMRHPVPGVAGKPFQTLVNKPLICRRGTGFSVLRTRQFYAYDCAQVRATRVG